MSLANLNVNQQTALANAQTTAGMDVLNLNNQQQTAISNSNLFRTFELQNLNNNQQATMQNAVQLATMDMTNLTNAQQRGFTSPVIETEIPTTKVIVTETDIRSVSRNVDGVYSRATVVQ